MPTFNANKVLNVETNCVAFQIFRTLRPPCAQCWEYDTVLAMWGPFLMIVVDLCRHHHFVMVRRHAMAGNVLSIMAWKKRSGQPLAGSITA